MGTYNSLRNQEMLSTMNMFVPHRGFASNDTLTLWVYADFLTKKIDCPYAGVVIRILAADSSKISSTPNTSNRLAVAAHDLHRLRKRFI